MSKSEEYASRLPDYIRISDGGIYVVVIDTDSYAGNFEREMAAYAAGAYDEERYHGKTQLRQFLEAADEEPELDPIASKVGSAYHSEYEEVSNTIWTTPGILNSGSGIIIADNGSDEVKGYPAYNSVAIFFDEACTDSELAIIKARAEEYAKNSEITVTGIRQLHCNVKGKPIESVRENTEPTVQVYGLTRDLGDGSSTIVWFRDRAVVDCVLDDESDAFVEEFYGNDGSPAITLTFPATLDLNNCGFRFSDNRYRKE